jgi:hypothetical protein
MWWMLLKPGHNLKSVLGREVYMHWKKWIYWLIPFCIVSAVVVAAVTDRSIGGRLAWGGIFSDFLGAVVFILTGLVMIADYENLLDRLYTRLGWAMRHRLWCRFIGCIFLLSGLAVLASALEAALAALGIIS